MKKKYFGANWKMNYSIGMSKEFFTSFKSLYDINNTVHDIVVFPPMHLVALAHRFTQFLFYDNSQMRDNDMFPAIHLVNFCCQGDKGFSIGAQNFYYEDNGAYTGEVSVSMLVDSGIKQGIVGHSERRLLFNETDDDINKKLKKALSHDMNSVLCCGESLEIRENNKAKEFVGNQLDLALKGIDPSHSHHLVVAYEPIWAIGTGKVASLEQIEEMHAFINEKLTQLGFDTKIIRVIYGGSVNDTNSGEILKTPYVDGCLVGSASLDGKKFASIITSI